MSAERPDDFRHENDPHLEAGFAALEQVRAPDLWPRIEQRAGRSPRRAAPMPQRAGRRRSRHAGPIAAALLLLAGLVVALWSAPDERPTEVTSGQLDDPQSSALDSPLIDAGSAIVDVRLAGGDRLRLELPESLAEEFTLIERPPPAPILLEGDRSTVTISFQYCPDQRRLGENGLGALVGNLSGVVHLCRPDELLVMTVVPEAALATDELDRFDLRPIEIGDAYGPILAAAWPEYTGCLECAPWGPIALDGAGVVVNRLSPVGIAAVDATTLSQRWSLATAGAPVVLRGPIDDDGFYLDSPRSALFAHDGDGSDRWAIEYEPGESAVGVSSPVDDVWLLRSSFVAEGDDDPPVLRRFDPGTGEVSWRAEGRTGARWQETGPLVVDDLVVVIDALESDARTERRAGSRLFAFDLDTGELRWTADLDAGAGTVLLDAQLRSMDLVEGTAIFASGSNGEVVRIDPRTGELVWRISLPEARITGTAPDLDGSLDLAVDTADGPVRVDPKNREITPLDEAPEQFVCPVTEPPAEPFVPPATWPAQPVGDDVVWFGTDDLWTVIDRGPTRQRKSIYWSANFPGGSLEERPGIEVWYERLDTPAVPVVFTAPGTNASTVDDGHFMINGIAPSEPGCWRATATYKGAVLTHVYES